MSITVLKQIEDSEVTAESIRMDALKQAREMIKSVEEACVIEARQSAKVLGEEMQKRAEDARVLIGDEIKSLEVRRSTERESLRARAQARVGQAGQDVFERVVDNGHR